MTTRKLYYEDSHLSRCLARVIECRPVKQGWEAILDQTVFFPAEGGQPCDQGRIGNLAVTYVREEDGIVYHGISQPLPEGGSFECAIDWPYRFSLMQNHSGEHIVSGLIHAQYGYDNVGFHMGNDRITLDMNGMLTKEQLRDIERRANQAVWANLPVTAKFPPPAELKNLSYRSKLELESSVRIVQIGEIDRCACCAPHVKATGEIGMIRLLNLQSYKGGVRISMLCGERALEQSFCVQDQIEALGTQFSVRQDEVLEAVRKFSAAYQDLLEERNQLSTELLRRRAADYPPACALRCVFTGPMGEELRIFANFLAQRNEGITALFAGGDSQGYRYILISPGQDVRPLQQTMKERLKAKGGGSCGMVRGSVACGRKEIEAFFENYRKSSSFSADSML